MSRKIALLIGVSKYGEGIPALSAPPNDVIAMERVLKNPDLGGFDEVETLIDPDLTVMQISIHRLFGDRAKDDLVLLFFSGHGITDDSNRLYFATKGTSKNVYKATSVSASFVQDVSRESYAKRQVIVLDCCYSGAFAEGWQVKSVGLDLKRELGAEGRVVLTSSTATQTSFQQDGAMLSLYTQYLVEGLETGSAACDGKAMIYARELHEYAKRKVQEAKPKQKPAIISDREGYDILLSRACVNLSQDWGNSPDISSFFGRTKELDILHNWIIDEGCRLVSIVGIAGVGKTRLPIKLGKGGIGKTDLSLKFAKSIQNKFEYVIWRSLLNGPSITEILKDLIVFFSSTNKDILSLNIKEQIDLLIQCLKNNKCLIILDNFETILSSNTKKGGYRDGYQEYGYLLKQIAEINHKSCLLITSREKPREIALKASQLCLVRSIDLKGLDETNGRKIFEKIGKFYGSDDDWKQLIEFYNGNPLALEIIALHIQSIFSGDISGFLENGLQVFGELENLLDWHFNRLSNLEKEVFYWLSINREPVSLMDLKSDLFLSKSKNKVAETMQYLSRKIPLEKVNNKITLQPVLIEYLNTRLIKTIVEEIGSKNISVLNTHSLMKANSKEYVRESQKRFILKPIIDELVEVFGDKNLAINNLYELILTQKKNNKKVMLGYCGGNLINLITFLEKNIKNYDFSNMAIWQAHLQEVTLHNVDLSFSDLSKSAFTETFGSIFSVNFSPNGKLLATSDTDGEIHLWQVEDNQKILIFKAHTNWIWSIRFSPDSTMIASGSSDQTVKLWDVSTTQCLKTFRGHSGRVHSVTFHPNSPMLASGCADTSIILWDIKTSKILKQLQGHSNVVTSVVFSPNGDFLASASNDCSVKLWDVKTGDCVKIMQKHIDTVTSVAFSPNSKFLASASDDCSIRLWDIATGDCIKIMKKHTQPIKVIEFDKSGKLLVSGSNDTTIKIWDVNQGDCIKSLEGHNNWVRSLSINSNKKIIASASVDQMIKIWEISSGKCLKIFKGYTNGIRAIALSQTDNIFASGSEDQTIRIWDFNTGQCLKILKNENWIWSVAFSTDTQLLASGSADRKIKLWNAKTSEIVKIMKGHEHWVWSVVFSPTDRILASASEDMTVRLWDIDTGECINILKGHTKCVWSVIFSSDGQFIASGSQDQTIKIWEVNTGKCLKTLEGHSNWVRSIVFSPCNQMIVSGSADTTVKIWDFKTGVCIATLEGHKNGVRSVALSPDGKILASGSADTTIRVWDFYEKKCLNTLLGHTNNVWSVVFSKNGQYLVSGSQDELIKIWSLEKGNCLHTLRPMRPYEHTNISNISGLTNAQIRMLKNLGAVDNSINLNMNN
ncbi:caspase, EACC1-associated type [Spirulina sp. 06S082]|uniref:caspase, EACC1-associated type n=1 Tax=Spirulina sp. 06S082 TaxID=3110248 RepID=UPI002B21B277|nr:caspase family protein [Spirulina sp. 06S082]MEA5472318.1 caspase family protein [Spirulina sp. 06S082]